MWSRFPSHFRGFHPIHQGKLFVKIGFITEADGLADRFNRKIC